MDFGRCNEFMKRDHTLLIFCVCIILALVLPTFLTRDWLLGSWFHFDTVGPVGDTIGGIMNPFIAIGAAWLTYKAFVIQYEANQELKLNTEINRFETTFFSLLAMQQSIVEGLILKVEVFRKDCSERKTLETETVVLHGRDTLRKIYEEGSSDKIDLSKRGLIAYGGIKHCIAQNGYDYMSKNEDLSFLDCYFRHLYRIVKFVDECTVLDRNDRSQYKERYKYICFLRAQLTDYELGLLFYNCLSKNGIKKFKPLVERYALFNNLRDKMLNNPVEDKKLYENGAFEFQ